LPLSTVAVVGVPMAGAERGVEGREEVYLAIYLSKSGSRWERV